MIFDLVRNVSRYTNQKLPCTNEIFLHKKKNALESKDLTQRNFKVNGLN